MRMILPAALVVGLFPGIAGRAPAQDQLRALIERAVQAHGGEARLARVRADRVKSRGIIFLDGQKVPFTAETSIQLPGQFKNVLRYEDGGRPNTLVQVLDGDRAWVSINGQTATPDGAMLNEMKEMMYMDNVVRLLPLLRDSRCTLSALGAVTVNGRPARGVKVASRGHKDIHLYFDQESGLLVKTEHQVVNNQKQSVRQEEIYSDFREVNGYLRPMKVVAYRDGKKMMEGELTEIQYFDKLPDSEFAKP